MITIAVIVVLGILLLVFLILSVKSWRVLHLTMLFMVYVAMSFSLLLFAKAFRIQNAWQKQALQNQRTAEEQEKAYLAAVYGDENEISLPENSYLGISAMLDAFRVGQGRVWRRARATAGTNSEEVTLTLVDGEDQDLAADSLSADTILYAFRNTARTMPGPDGGAPAEDGTNVAPQEIVADNYIGAIRISSITGNAITAQALEIADQDEFNNKTRTWALYERAPVDMHGVFRTAAGIDSDPSAAELDVDAYQNRIRPVIKFYMPQEMVGISNPSEYESFVDSFAFDGMRLDAIRGWLEANGNRRFDPDLTQVWDRIEFTEESPEFKVNASEALSLRGSDQIDDTGLAVAPSLKAGSDTIKFAKNEQVLVDAATARNGITRDRQLIMSPLYDPENLAANTKLKVLYSIYRRELFDFPTLINATKEMTEKLDDRTQRVSINNELSKTAAANLQEQIEIRTGLVTNLKTDNERLAGDLSLINDLLATKTEELNQTQLRINALYLDISRLHGQIQSVSAGQ